MSVAQAKWNEMIQMRITKTSNMLAQLKVMKMTGADEALLGLLQRLRVAEIAKSMVERTLRICITVLGECKQPTLEPPLQLQQWLIGL